MNSTTPHAIDPPATVLYVHDGPQQSSICEDLCRPGDRRAHLQVSYATERTEPPQGDGGAPERLGLLSIGDVLRASEGAADDADEPGPDFSSPVVVEAIDDPTDLAAIGTTISRYCERWGEAFDLTVCFRSLESVIHHTSPKTAFQFALVLAKRFASVDAHAHVHFDASAFDDATVATFATVFDHVVFDTGLESTPEATDDEVAAVLETWDDEDEDGGFIFDTVETPTVEATDEEIARLLE